MHSPYFRRRLGCLACAVLLGWLAVNARAGAPAAGPAPAPAATRGSP